MTDYIPNAAYFLPDGTEVIYSGESTVTRHHASGEKTSISGELVWFPRERSRSHELLDGRTLSPRMVECGEGHSYHLQLLAFPTTKPCPECAPGDIEAAFEARNFDIWGTGGGCTAWTWVHTEQDGTEWLVRCSDDCSAPRRAGDFYYPQIYIEATDPSGKSIDFAEVSTDYGDYTAWAAGWCVDLTAAGEYDVAPEPVSKDHPELVKLAAREDIPADVRQWVHEAVDALMGKEVV